LMKPLGAVCMEKYRLDKVSAVHVAKTDIVTLFVVLHVHL
jgi:hypothetical protein